MLAKRAKIARPSILLRVNAKKITEARRWPRRRKGEAEGRANDLK